MASIDMGKVKPLIVIPLSNKGGCGKTTAMALFANWLKLQGKNIAAIDTDAGNWNNPAGFSHWFKSGVLKLNIQDESDLERIFDMASEFTGDAVLCDLPANSKCSTQQFFEELCTPEALDKIGVRLLCIVPISPSVGAVESALDYLNVIGPRATYIIALNRMQYTKVPKSLEETFPDWYRIESHDFDFKILEISNLNQESMAELVKKGNSIPFKLNGDMRYWTTRRIDIWASKVNKQLDGMGIL